MGHDEKDLTATWEAISSTEAQADISKMNEILEVSVKTEVVVDISAKVCLTPIESSPEVAMIQLDDATNTATLQNEATEQLEELIAKPIVVSVEGAIEDAVQDQGNDTNEFLVNEVEIIPVYTEGITRAFKNLEVNEEVQEILDTVETDANFDFNGSKHNEEGIEAASIQTDLSDTETHTDEQKLGKQSHLIADDIDESIEEVDGGVSMGEDLSTDDALSDTASEKESCDEEVKLSPRETLKKVSESLQKAQKRLSKPFGKKPTPGTPDSAIAECLEEDHISAKAEMEPKDNGVSELSSNTDDKKDTSTTPNVTEAIKEKKSSGLGSYIKKIKTPKNLFKKKEKKGKEMGTTDLSTDDQITEFATEEEVAETATADPTEIDTKEVADIIIEVDAVPLLEMTEKGILIDEQAADNNGTTDGIMEEATAVLQFIIGELVEKSEVFEDVDAETDDDLSFATTQDSKEDTLTESSDMAEDTTLIKSTEISIVEDMCVKEEIVTDVTDSDTLGASSSLVNCIEATEATEETETTEATEATFVESTNQESIQQAEEAEVKHTGFILKKHTVISNQYTAKMPKFEEKLRQLSFTAAHGDQLAENAVEIQLKLAQLKLT